MKHIEQRDLDAIRAGIREQERREWQLEKDREMMKKLSERKPVDQPKLIRADELRVGDQPVLTSSSHYFYEDPTGPYTRIVPVDDTHVWVEQGGKADAEAPAANVALYSIAGGARGSRIATDAPVLIAKRA